ncbi:helix-turn-helix domain-containing protein, partial [Pseudonocardia sp. SID8383]
AVSALLACARALQAAGTDLRQGTLPPLAEELGPVTEEPAAAAPAPVEAAPEPSGSGLLSERELEVAELVVQGRTQREIGEALFISAKTVEHHVARMRQRLGVGGRSELLDELRRILGDRG